MRRTIPILLALALVACSGDPSGPSRPELAGTYLLTELTFDPQGVLPLVDIRERLAGDVPRLILTPAGQAQLIFEDPATGLITTATGTFSTPQVGARIDFGPGDVFRNVLLSRRMTFAAGAGGTLTFAGTAPDGISRQRLLQLVPEFSGEQLLDPVPGELTVVFTRAPAP